MQIPETLRPPTPEHERKRIKERIAREAERKRTAMGAPPNVGIGRKPSGILLILVGLILVGGLLLSRVDYRFGTRKRRPKAYVAEKELDVLRTALDHFRNDCGRYPSLAEGLKALVSNPGLPEWNGPYVNLVKPDPWRTPYGYRLDGTNVAVFSAGPDRTPATPDDLQAAPAPQGSRRDARNEAGASAPVARPQNSVDTPAPIP
jgi:general secretion pathway protein G